MKILLAIDGSESAKAAIDFASGFPLPPNSEIRLITVVEREIFHSGKEAKLAQEQRELLEETKHLLHEVAEDLLADGKARLMKAGWTASTQILSGHPSREIINAVKELQADLLVVGSHGLGGVKRFLLGSVTGRVLNYAPCSVLIVRPRKTERETVSAVADQPRLKLLLAYDESESARQAADFCAALRLDENTEVCALTVLPLVTLYRQDIKQRLSWIWKEKKKMAEKALARLPTEWEWSTPHVSTKLREAADVSQEILDVAKETDTDLILLGYRGKGAIERFLVGSVTTRVAHHAPCSVLAVRNPSN